MLWIKSFHIMFVVAWYAGLLYLPRLFVYHAGTEDRPGRERFKVMERKLFAIMTIGAAGAMGFGLYLWLAYMPALAGGWLHVKLLLVAVLAGFHVLCYAWMRAFARDANVRSERFYRLVNEVPALILVAVVILVVVKPF